MTEPTAPLPDTATPISKPKRPRRPQAGRGSLPLGMFRSLLEIVQSQRENLNDECVQAVEKILHAFANDSEGTVRFVLSAGAAKSPRPRFTSRANSESEVPGDDAIRALTREIALVDDDADRHNRIESLGEKFLRRAAELYALKADTISGLRTAYADAVADVRQMEQIAASGQPKAKPDIALAESPPDRPAPEQSMGR